jgi:hypothetical protein
LPAVYPRLNDPAIRQLGGDDVRRFVGWRTHTRFNGEVKTERRRRVEGRRIQHGLEENSLKRYDQQGAVLRSETTLNPPRRFKVRRVTARHGRIRKVPPSFYDRLPQRGEHVRTTALRLRAHDLAAVAA